MSHNCRYRWLIVLLMCLFTVVIQAQTLPNLLVPIDFSLSGLKKSSSPCDLLLEETTKPFWELVEGVETECIGWEETVLSYVTRERSKILENLIYIQSIVEANQYFSDIFKVYEGGETVFTSESLSSLGSMIYYDEKGRDLMGWLYEGLEVIEENTFLSNEEMESLVLKVANCSSHSREKLEPSFLAICEEVQDFNFYEGTDQKLGELIVFYGEVLMEYMVPEWETLVCVKEGDCPPIVEGTFDFFLHQRERFQIGGACAFALYVIEFNQLCKAIESFGLESVDCMKDLKLDAMDFEVSCN